MYILRLIGEEGHKGEAENKLNCEHVTGFSVDYIRLYVHARLHMLPISYTCKGCPAEPVSYTPLLCCMS